MAQEHEETYEDRKKNWDLSGSLENIIHRYIHQITNAELKEINLEMQAGMLESEIKAGIKLPLVEMRQRRETFLLQKEKSFSEPVITILKSDTADLPAGSKLSLLDADDLLLRRNPGSVEYQIQFLLRGKEKVQNAVIDLSKLSGTGTFADSIVGDASFAPSSVNYLKKHRDLSILERAAKRVLRVNKKSDMRAYANALLSYVQEARNCLNLGQNLPKRPSRKDFTEKSTIKYSDKETLKSNQPESTTTVDDHPLPQNAEKSEIVNTADSADTTTPESKEVQPQEAYSESNMISFDEPQVTILQSTVPQIPAGAKMSLADTELMFKGQTSGYVAYQIDYTLVQDNFYHGSYHGKVNFDRTHDKSLTAQIRAAALAGPAEMSPQDFSKLTPESMKKYQVQMNWIIDNFVPYLQNHQNLSVIRSQADNILLNPNRESWETPYAKELLSYVEEAQECLNKGESLPALPSKEHFQLAEQPLENPISPIPADSQPAQNVKTPAESVEKPSKVPVTINEKLLASPPHDGKILSQIPASKKYVELEFLSSLDNGKTFLATIDPDKEYPLWVKENDEWKPAGSRFGDILSYSYGNVKAAAQKEFERLRNQDSAEVQDSTHRLNDPTVESPEAEHLQKKAADLLDISQPLVDQEAFQEVFQALQQNEMPQAADMLHFLASHLDEVQEHYRSMQEEFRRIKPQIADIDKKLFTDSVCVSEAQSELDRGERFIQTTKNRLANQVMNTRDNMMSSKKSALISLAESIRVPETLEMLQNCMQRAEKSLDNVFYRLNDTRHAIHDVALGVKNIGRSLSGKELLTYKPWDMENGAIASMQRKIYAMERGLNHLQKQAKTLQDQMRPPKNKVRKQLNNNKKGRPTTINI